MLLQHDVLAATLDQEYAKLRARRSALPADLFCREVISLYRKGVQCDAPSVQYINRWSVKDLVHYWPTFHAQYGDNRNVDTESIILDFQSLIQHELRLNLQRRF
jgi:hypothetical protein